MKNTLLQQIHTFFGRNAKFVSIKANIRSKNQQFSPPDTKTDLRPWVLIIKKSVFPEKMVLGRRSGKK